MFKIRKRQLKFFGFLRKEGLENWTFTEHIEDKMDRGKQQLLNEHV